MYGAEISEALSAAGVNGSSATAVGSGGGIFGGYELTQPTAVAGGAGATEETEAGSSHFVKSGMIYGSGDVYICLIMVFLVYFSFIRSSVLYWEWNCCR